MTELWTMIHDKHPNDSFYKNIEFLDGRNKCGLCQYAFRLPPWPDLWHQKFDSLNIKTGRV